MSGPSSLSGDARPAEGALPAGAVVVRAADVETLTGGPATIRLLADSEATGGALSSQRVTLARGADGAVPHTHKLSTELFYVLDGSLDVLVGDRVLTAAAGDVLVVPPELPHAFAASRDSTADLLIVLTPGVERFEYFRQLGRIVRGELAAESLLDMQDRFDTHFLVSPPWRAARSSR